MRRMIFAAVPLALLVLAAPASAGAGKHAVVYKAKLAPVAAAPEAEAAGGEAEPGSDEAVDEKGGSDEPGSGKAGSDEAGRDKGGSDEPGRDKAGRDKAGLRGKALLVDGPRRDVARLHVRGLAAGEGYTWSVRQAAAGGDACAGEAVAAFEYAAFDARRHGKGKARARSRDFTAAKGAAYALVVTAADGTDVACGEFARHGRRHGKGGHKGDDAPGAEGRGGDKRGADDPSGEDFSDDDSVEDEDSLEDDSVEDEDFVEHEDPDGE